MEPIKTHEQPPQQDLTHPVGGRNPSEPRLAEAEQGGGEGANPHLGQRLVSEARDCTLATVGPAQPAVPARDSYEQISSGANSPELRVLEPGPNELCYIAKRYSDASSCSKSMIQFNSIVRPEQYRILFAMEEEDSPVAITGKYICRHHADLFKKNKGNNCCNKKQHKKAKKGYKNCYVKAAQYFKLTAEDKLIYNINDILCQNCFTDFSAKSMPSEDFSSTDSEIEVGSPVASSSDLSYPSPKTAISSTKEVAIDKLNALSQSMDISPLCDLKRKAESSQKAIIAKKVGKVTRNLMAEFKFDELAGEDSIDLLKLKQDSLDLNELMDELAIEVQKAKYTEKLKLLTLVPKSWTQEQVVEKFNVTRHIAKLSKELKGNSGILAEPRKKKGKPLSSTIVEELQAFYTSEEICRKLPGKSDYISVKGADGVRRQEQKHLLLGNLRELRVLFQQNTGYSISQSKFNQLRPKYCVLLSKTGYHNVCCCVYHENVRLMYEVFGIGYKEYKQFLTKLVCSLDNKDCMFRRCDLCKDKALEFQDSIKTEFAIPDDELEEEIVQFDRWETTDRDIRQTISLPFPDFMEKVTKDSISLLKHHYIMKAQSEYFSSIKPSASNIANFDDTQMIVQCDFAENYNTVFQDEIQSAYFRNNNPVTIHPFVCFYVEDGKAQKQSFCAISNDVRHDTNTYYAFQCRLMEWVGANCKRIQNISYVTDGCAAQYKNHKNFMNLLHHKSDFGISAQHHFFASGHGKSACDGIGGTVKRLARQASLSGKSIKTAIDFSEFVEQNMKSIIPFYVSSEQIETIIETHCLEERYARSKTIPQTRQAHKYVPDKEKLYLYETSKDHAHFGMVTRPNDPTIGVIDLIVGDWVAAVYDDEWYFGEVIAIDVEHEECEITYLKEPGSNVKNKTFTRENKNCYVPYGQILQKIPTPKSNRNGRTFTWSETTREEIHKKFAIFNEKH
jgi:hypothetical protein